MVATEEYADQRGDVGPRAEGPLLEESTAPEAKVNIPSSNLEITTLTVPVLEQSLPVSDSPMETTQPSYLLATTQGSYRSERLCLLFVYNPLDSNALKSFLMVLYRLYVF